MLIKMNPYAIVEVYERVNTMPEGVAALVKEGIDFDIAEKLIYVLDAAADKWEVDLSAKIML